MNHDVGDINTEDLEEKRERRDKKTSVNKDFEEKEERKKRERREKEEEGSDRKRSAPWSTIWVPVIKQTISWFDSFCSRSLHFQCPSPESKNTEYLMSNFNTFFT